MTPEQKTELAKRSLKLIEHPDGNERINGINILMKLGLKSAIKVILPKLNDPDSNVRKTAIRAVAMLQGKNAVADIAPYLDDPVPEIRMEVMSIIGSLGKEESLAVTILKTLKDPVPTVRERAIEVLAAFPAEIVLNHIMGMMSDENSRVRLVAIKAVKNLGQKKIPTEAPPTRIPGYTPTPKPEPAPVDTGSFGNWPDDQSAARPPDELISIPDFAPARPKRSLAEELRHFDQLFQNFQTTMAGKMQKGVPIKPEDIQKIAASLSEVEQSIAIIREYQKNEPEKNKKFDTLLKLIESIRKNIPEQPASRPIPPITPPVRRDTSAPPVTLGQTRPTAPIKPATPSDSGRRPVSPELPIRAVPPVASLPATTFVPPVESEPQIQLDLPPEPEPEPLINVDFSFETKNTPEISAPPEPSALAPVESEALIDIDFDSVGGDETMNMNDIENALDTSLALAEAEEDVLVTEPLELTEDDMNILELTDENSEFSEDSEVSEVSAVVVETLELGVESEEVMDLGDEFIFEATEFDLASAEDEENTGTTEQVMVTALDEIPEDDGDLLILDSSREETPPPGSQLLVDQEAPDTLEDVVVTTRNDDDETDDFVEDDDDDDEIFAAVDRDALKHSDDDEADADESEEGLDEADLLSNQFYQAMEAIHNKEDATVRLTGVRTFETLIGKRHIIEHLEELVMYDPDPQVRAAAIDVIGKVEDPASVDLITRAFRDTNETVKVNALYALGRTHNPQAFLTIVTAMKDHADNIRASATEALGLLGDPRAQPYLLNAIKDSSMMVKSMAIASLGDLRDPAIRDDIVKIFNSTTDPLIKLGAAYAIVKLGGKKALDIIKESLNESNILVKVRACLYLGRLADPETLPLLEKASKDSNKLVQQSALRAIQQLQVAETKRQAI